jgi:hypothetical protein
MKYTAEQVEQAIDAWFEANGEYRKTDEFSDEGHQYGDFPSSWFELDECSRSKSFTLPGIGNLRIEDSYGGSEGDGEQMWVVLTVTWIDNSHGRDRVRTAYFRKDGFYSSFGESNYDGDFKQVQRKKVIATVYEEVK